MKTIKKPISNYYKEGTTNIDWEKLVDKSIVAFSQDKEGYHDIIELCIHDAFNPEENIFYIKISNRLSDKSLKRWYKESEYDFGTILFVIDGEPAKAANDSNSSKLILERYERLAREREKESGPKPQKYRTPFGPYELVPEYTPIGVSYEEYQTLQR